jgi:PST family polysaccharide transporter
MFDFIKSIKLKVLSNETGRLALLKGASWYFLEKFVRLIGAFLIGAWVARYLGPENYGALAFALALVATLSFFGSLGIESIVVRDLVEGKKPANQVLSTYFFMRLLGSLFVPLLGILYVLFTRDDDQHLMGILVFISSGAIIFGSFDVVDCWLQSKSSAKTTSIIRLSGFFVGALLRGSLILLYENVIWFAVVGVLETAVIALLYIKVLRQHGIELSFNNFSLKEFKHMIIDGKMMILSGATVAAYSKIDVLVVGTLLSKEAVGSYAIAASMCAAWNMVGMSVVQAWAPRVSQANAKSRNEYIQAIKQLCIVVMLLSLIGAVIFTFTAQAIFTILLGVKYLDGAIIFSILSWSSIFVFLGVATSQIIVNEKIYWVSMLRTSIGLCFSLIIISTSSSSYWGTKEFALLMVVTSAVATLSILFSSKARHTILQIIRPIKTL